MMRNLPETNIAPGRVRQELRRGVALVAVLVAIALMIVMMSVTLQWALRNRREARQQLHLTQATWLCEAGLQRAIRKSISDSSYRGEHWKPMLPEFPMYEVSVQVSVESTPPNVSYQVVAELFNPNSFSQRFRRSLSYSLPAPTN
jgi:type II secretory pathway pseudopilin PulG